MPITRKIKPEVNSAVKERAIEAFIDSKPQLADDQVKNIGLSLYGNQINRITSLRSMLPKSKPGAKRLDKSQEDWIRDAINEKIERDWPAYEAWKEAQQ